MIALRADFYGRVAAYPELAAAVVAHQALIGPMAPGGSAPRDRAAGRQQRAACCSRASSTRSSRISRASRVRCRCSRMRCLRHGSAARRLQLTVGGYREAGGVRGAIAQTAEHTLQALPEADREVARSIFLSLTDVDEGAEPTGGASTARELAAPARDGDRLERVLGVLADARLVSVDEGTVVVAHEALIRHWPRLRGWIEADRAGLGRPPPPEAGRARVGRP